MDTINIETILAGELTGENDWNLISKSKLTLDQMRTFKNQLNWHVVFRTNANKNIDNKFIDELIEEGIIKYEKNDYYSTAMFMDIQEKHAVDIWFIKKYKDYFDIRVIGMLGKFKASELLNMFGKPSVGTGVTYTIGSDSYPYTVIESDPKGLKIKIQSDTAIPFRDYKNSNNFYVDQTYKYECNPNGNIIELRLNAKGRWKNGDDCGAYSFGTRRKYLDPSF